jgi:Tat-targeted selenate reductase subunit YnfE
MPGVSAMGQGAWHDANMAGDRIDHGACMNTLTTHRPSPLAKGIHSIPTWSISRRFKE